MFTLLRTKLSYLEDVDLPLSFDLSELRSRLPDGQILNFCEYNGSDAGQALIKTILTLGNASSTCPTKKACV